jgi:GTP-binding protein
VKKSYWKYQNKKHSTPHTITLCRISPTFMDTNTKRNTGIRNIAIIAHVDHGKTTLVDHLLRQSGIFRENQAVVTRVMDSNDLEREKGITIMAKNAAVTWNGTKINIVDTPGHSDFGGEVERILSMVDGVLLLVDAAEGPLPQTRFVLKKALGMNLTPIVVINKIDRSDARADEVLDEVMQLFINLEADYEQLNFPVIYAIAKQGIAKRAIDEESSSLDPLFETVIATIPGPAADAEQPFQMIIAALDWNDYVGRIAVGRVHRGRVKVGDSVALLHPDGSKENSRITKLYVYEGNLRKEVESAEAGDIIALSGFENVFIGDTIADSSNPEQLPYVNIDEPTLAMNFCVNTSPFAGREGKFVTTPKLRERLYRETRTNVALRVVDTDSADVFKVSGRGELQLAILIETMRREGYEFAVSKPEVLYKRDENGKIQEPMEHVIVDVSQAQVGTVIELLGRRKAEMLNMTPAGDSVRAEFIVPSRGLIGFRTEFLTATRGEGILHHTFHGYDAYKGDFATRTRGSLVSMESGPSTAYALEMVQERGVLFVAPGVDLYEGMVVGENSREDDLVVNPCRTKHLTNMRASGSDGVVKLDTPRQMSLEQFIEFIADDELLEVTPQSIRIRKRILDATERNRMKKRLAAADAA